MPKDDLDFDSIKFLGEMPQPDPPPKEPSKRSTESKRPVGRPSTTAKLKEVQDEIENLLLLMLLPVLLRDSHIAVDETGQPVGEPFTCADVYCTFDMRKGKPVLTADGVKLAEAMAAIIFESPFLMKVLQSGDSWGKYLKLFMALQPGYMAVIHNHVQNRQRNYGGGTGSVEAA